MLQRIVGSLTLFFGKMNAPSIGDCLNYRATNQTDARLQQATRMDRENDTGEDTSGIFLEGESGDRGATSLVAAGGNVGVEDFGNGHANFESNIEDEQLSDNEQTDQATNNNLPSAVTYQE